MAIKVWHFPQASVEQLTGLLERVARVLLHHRLARFVCVYKLYLGSGGDVQRLTTWHDSTDPETLHVGTKAVVTTTTAFEQILRKSQWAVRQQVKLDGQLFDNDIRIGQLTQGPSRRGIVIQADEAVLQELLATTGIEGGIDCGAPSPSTYFELIGK